MTVTPDPRHVASIQAANVNIGGRQTIITDGQAIEVPTRLELIAYLGNVRKAYSRWADDSAQDVFVATRALPMRLAEYRAQPTANAAPSVAAPSVALLTAVQDAKRTIILGEPGAGKSAALERLAWVTASAALQQAQGAAEAPLTVPLLARLADYRGEADLIPLLRRALNELGPWQLGDASVRLLLWANNLRFMLLLDGLNELEQAHVSGGRKAVRGHLRDYGDHIVHLSCRTADFDAVQEANPELQVLPGAELWTVQELVDAIDYWADADGESDVRDYLRFHLGESNGQRVYDHLRADDRLANMARIPLFLWLFRTAAEDAKGKLPSDRGELLHSFVHSPRVLGRVPQSERATVERGLECVGWAMQQAGVLQINFEPLYDALEQAKGRRSMALDVLRDGLKLAGLLIDLGDERYKLLHQLLQEYAAAAYLLRSRQARGQVPLLAQDDRWRETCIAALWLDKQLHTPAYLFSMIGDPKIDLRVRVAAATILGEVGDPRFVRTPYAGDVAAMEPALVPIPAGLATLGGDDPEADADEQPVCQVAIAAFDLAVYPVTNVEFACFVEAGGYADETLWTAGGRAWLRGEGQLDAETERDLRDFYQSFSRDVEAWIGQTKQTQAMDDALADNYRWWATQGSEERYIKAYAEQILAEQRREPYYWHDGRFNQASQPVVGVNWYEAMAYAAWLAKVTGKPYRLPTEAEWEWAARRNARRYPWGDEWDGARCNWQGSRLNRPNPVGVYPHGATADGLHELAGNVYEWTASLYRGYGYAPDDGREAVDVDGLRVVRGGSWYTDRDTVRCAFRDWNYPRIGDDNSGFRLARASL